MIPEAVAKELSHPDAPQSVRSWIKVSPEWLEIDSTQLDADPELQKLDSGEQAAIMLAELHNATLLIVDEKAARQVARRRQIQIAGLLGVLASAHSKGLLNLPEAIARLQKTSFYVSKNTIENILEIYSE